MKVDMSPQAVRSRLELVGQLWRLGVALRKAKMETDARKEIETSPQTVKPHNKEKAV
jgi:hypothetical protein